MKNRGIPVLSLTITIILLLILSGIVVRLIEKKRVITNANKIENLTAYNTSIKFSYELGEINTEKAKILIIIQDSENGIDKVEMPEKDVIMANGRKKRIGIDYEIEVGKMYEIKIMSSNGEIKTETILITQDIQIIPNTTEWTNQNIVVEVNYGKIDEALTKEISIDGGKTYKTYIEPIEIEHNTIVKARIKESKTSETELKIDNIDKLPPKDTEIIIGEYTSKTSANLQYIEQDDEETEMYGKSGIKEIIIEIYEGSQILGSYFPKVEGICEVTNISEGKVIDIIIKIIDFAGNERVSSLSSWKVPVIYEWQVWNTIEKKAVLITEIVSTGTEVWTSSSWKVNGIIDYYGPDDIEIRSKNIL